MLVFSWVFFLCLFYFLLVQWSEVGAKRIGNRLLAVHRAKNAHRMTPGQAPPVNVEEFKCNRCLQSYDTEEHLEQHYSATGHHPLQKTTCPTCNERLENKKSFHKHLEEKNHRAHCPSPACTQSYTTNNRLKQHLDTYPDHETENIEATHKLYPCKKCTSSYSDPRNLREHEKTHEEHGANPPLVKPQNEIEQYLASLLNLKTKV
eukprot:Platyproteum_vivax@DN3739_c0_g1_i1.p1